MAFSTHGTLRRRLPPWFALVPALLAAAPAVPAQQAVPIDPTALVRRAVANRLAEEAHHHPLRFVFLKHDNGHSFTRYIMETPQGDVARLVAINGAPLGPLARRNELTRLHNLAANPALQQHRLKGEQADQARIDKLLRLLPDAFLYRYAGTEPCDVATLPLIPIPGVSGASSVNAPPAPPATCYHLTFTPNPRWNPPDMESRILQGMAGDIWIAAAGERLHRLTAHLVSDVQFGWGIVGRLNKGGTIFLEQNRVAGDDWELTHMQLNLTGKILLVRTLRIHINEQESDFTPVPARLDYRQAIKMLLASPPAIGR